MTRFLIKKIWWINLLSLSVFASQSKFKGRFEARAAHSKESFTSHRHRFFLEQTFSNDWINIVGSARAQAEGLSDSRSVVDLRDLYAGRKSGGWSLKLGFQEVVWGEAFGFYFADIINPKDLTELGLGEITANRLTLPMLNLKGIGPEGSVQFIIIPRPRLSRVAKPGSEFFAFNDVFTGASLTLEEPDAPDLGTVEAGLRLSTQRGNTNFAAFYFNGFDRTPPFTSTLGPPIVLRRNYVRDLAFGLSTSTEANSSVLRSEWVFHPEKTHQQVLPEGLTSATSPELVGVLGFDRSLNNWQLGLQASASIRSQDLSGAGPRTTEQLSLRVAGITAPEVDWELIASYLFHDGSSLLQPRVTLPLSRELELLISGEVFLGGSASRFGAFSRSSRVLMEFRATLSS